MKSFKEQVEKDILPAVQKELGISNVHAAPKVKKITIGVGIDAGSKDSKRQDVALDTLTRISGQKPVQTKAKKSISGFKVREGMVVGLHVTLRGQRMYDFLEKLVHIALPRIRDFRGISPKSVDATGNLTIGFKEHLSFPEIRSDEVELMHGLQITVTSNAKTREKGLALFKALGFPFTES